MSRQLMIPTADTQLFTVDTPGGSPPLLFLSGGFGTVAELEPRRRAPRGQEPRGPIRRAGTREVRHISRLLRAGSGRRRRTRHRGNRHRTPDPGRMVLRRNDRGALRGTPRRTGRWAGAHRRRVPDRHARRGRQGEGPRAVPPAGVDHAHPRRARPLGADVSRRIRGRRDRNGRGQRRARARLRGVGMPDGLRRRHRRALGCDRGRDAHGAGCRRRGRGEQPARVRLRDDARTSTPRSSARPPTQWSPRSRTSSNRPREWHHFASAVARLLGATTRCREVRRLADHEDPA